MLPQHGSQHCACRTDWGNCWPSRLSEIENETLLILGSADTLAPLVANVLLPAVRQARLVEIADGRHFVNVDHAVAFTRALLDFLPAAA